MKDTPENREKLGIPATADITWIDLDEQQEAPEMVTGGWTDTQIKGKTVGQIDELISQNLLAAESMEQALAKQYSVVQDLRKVRQRKLIIGGQ